MIFIEGLRNWTYSFVFFFSWDVWKSPNCDGELGVGTVLFTMKKWNRDESAFQSVAEEKISCFVYRCILW